MTKIIANSVHEYFETQNELHFRNVLLPVEQKECRRSSKERTDELLISKIVLNDLIRDTLILKWHELIIRKLMKSFSFLGVVELLQVCENIVQFIKK